MKIKFKNTMYVQKKDILYLTQSNILIPKYIYIKLLELHTFPINETNKYEFIRFNKIEEINFFNSINWIINYDDINKLNNNEIIKLATKIKLEQNEITNKMRKIANKSKEELMDLITEYELKNHEFYSLRDIYWIKEGQLNIEMPNEINTNKNLTKGR